MRACRACQRAAAYPATGKRSEELAARGLALAETLDHPNSLAHALHNGAICHQLVGDRDATVRGRRNARSRWPKNLGCCRGARAAWCLRGWATAVGSGVADAARLIDAEIGKATAAGPLPQYYLGLAAEVLLAAGRPADGLAHLDRAIAAIDEPGVGFYLPEIYRLRGECLLALDRDNKDEARQAFAAARDIAKRQGAIIFATPRRSVACRA